MIEDNKSHVQAIIEENIKEYFTKFANMDAILGEITIQLGDIQTDLHQLLSHEQIRKLGTALDQELEEIVQCIFKKLEEKTE